MKRLNRFWRADVLDLHREIRDGLSEAMFYQTYGGLFALYLAGQQEAVTSESKIVAEPPEALFVREPLESMTVGGYPEAVARVFALLARDDRPFPANS